VRVLISSTPEQSHLAPQLPLALELQRRGHEVLVACAAKLGSFAQQLGISAVAAGRDVEPNVLGRTDLGVSPPPRDASPADVDRWARRFFVEVFATALVDDLRRIAEDWRPDVLMRDRSEYAAWVVGDAVGKPVVTMTFGRLPQPAFEIDAAGDALERLRRTQGLGPDCSTLFAGPVLVPAPRSYVDPNESVLPSVAFVQPMVHDAGSESELPAWVAYLGERPVVYVTLGNIFNRELSFRPFVDALSNEPIDAIFTVGRSVDPSAFGPLPENVHVEQYISNSLLLPVVDAVVCHGGFNTVMGALTVGRPLVVAPFGADQPIHAQRCAALGVARVVDTHTLDPEAIRAATHAILNESSYRAAARQLQGEIAALPDIHAAAAIVEGCAAHS